MKSITKGLMKMAAEVVYLAAFLCVAGNAAADTGRTMLILDGSGSMWGQIDGRSKIEIARETVGEVLSDVAAGQPLGLMVYGHRREADCTDIEVLVSPAQGTSEEIRSRIEGVTPRGKTPIGDALIQAAEVLDYRLQPATVVLISDGIETCDVDLCQLAATLEADGFEFTSHIIGFGMDLEESATLECLASITGGQFVSAQNANDLGNALRETVLDEEETLPDDPPDGRLEDLVIRGSDVIFLAGRDDVVIPPRGPEHDAGFVIKRHKDLEEPLAETFPPFLEVKPGNVVQILDLAKGGIHFFPQPNAPGWGPAGAPGGGAADIESLDGISGYKGPRGALLGVFLDDQNPAGVSPAETLDFSVPEPGTNYTQLAPQIGQVFFIGDGTAGTTDVFKRITAPPGATRVFFGIADSWGFHGAPGFYDDNDGKYTIRIGIDATPAIVAE